MTGTQTPTSAKPKRRWLRFSLRTLLVVMLLLGCGFGWVGKQLQQKRRHVVVVKEIVRLGGFVDFSDGAPIPAWKKRIFGVYAVVGSVVALQNTDATDSILVQMKGMNCDDLYLSSSKITDSGLAHLQRMTGLEKLEVGNTQITDDGLKHLKGMASLTFLDLSNTQITDAGLVHLVECRNLQRVYLRFSMVSQQGVNRLQKALPGCDIYFTTVGTTSESTSQ